MRSDDDPTTDEAQAHAAQIISKHISKQVLDEAQALIAHLKRTQGVRVGMTREQLYDQFEKMGGISTSTHQTFMHRDHQNVLVEVEFKLFDERRDAQGRLVTPWAPWLDKKGRRVNNDRRDQVAKFKGPYLGFPAWD